MRNPFRYFKTSPEVIRLAVMMYVRFPLSLRQILDLPQCGDAAFFRVPPPAVLGVLLAVFGVRAWDPLAMALLLPFRCTCPRFKCLKRLVKT